MLLFKKITKMLNILFQYLNLCQINIFIYGGYCGGEGINIAFGVQLPRCITSIIKFAMAPIFLKSEKKNK